MTPLTGAPSPPAGALALNTCALTKRFGGFTAIDRVTMRVEPGSVHALLGENGAGKSTLVKCLAGFQRPDGGSILIDGCEHTIANPVAARALGIGMVYQHFTLAPGMSVAENLLLAGGKAPALIGWKATRRALTAFLETTPFRLDLHTRPCDMAAGEKQKLELLKQLYLKPRLLILDEPTSVLTPQEAGEVLGHVRAFARSGQCTVLLITHKFREVMAYADAVTVLRRGHAVAYARVAETNPARLAQAMMGAAPETGNSEQKVPQAIASHRLSAIKKGAAEDAAKSAEKGIAHPALQVRGLTVLGDRGTLALDGIDLTLRAGEILGVAGVSGNGQRELVEVLLGQRPRVAGQVCVAGQPYAGRRAESRRLKLRGLPEEPLRNACVAALSVAENMALRDFDLPPLAWPDWLAGALRFSVWRRRARAWIADYGIKTRDENAPIGSLSGGNVQRAVLARELAGQVNVLVAANPVFGLDFAAVADIHARIAQLRDTGAGVLLISEDLDELLERADRIVVMSGGRIVHETPAASAERGVLGAHMGGGAHGARPASA